MPRNANEGGNRIAAGVLSVRRGALNQKLATKGVYTRLVQKRLAVWIDVRNAADHGKFSEYSKEDVEEMHSGVSSFLERQLT